MSFNTAIEAVTNLFRRSEPNGFTGPAQEQDALFAPDHPTVSRTSSASASTFVESSFELSDSMKLEKQKKTIKFERNAAIAVVLIAIVAVVALAILLSNPAGWAIGAGALGLMAVGLGATAIVGLGALAYGVVQQRKLNATQKEFDAQFMRQGGVEVKPAPFTFWGFLIRCTL